MWGTAYMADVQHFSKVAECVLEQEGCDLHATLATYQLRYSKLLPQISSSKDDDRYGRG